MEGQSDMERMAGGIAPTGRLRRGVPASKKKTAGRRGGDAAVKTAPFKDQRRRRARKATIAEPMRMETDGSGTIVRAKLSSVRSREELLAVEFR